MNSVRVGVVGGKESGNVPGPRKLEPERGEPGPGEGRGLMPVEHGNRPATAWAGLTELTQITSDFMEVAIRQRAFLLIAAGGTG